MDPILSHYLLQKLESLIGKLFLLSKLKLMINQSTSIISFRNLFKVQKHILKMRQYENCVLKIDISNLIIQLPYSQQNNKTKLLKNSRYTFIKDCVTLYIRCDSKKKCQILSSHRTFMPTNIDLKLWLTNFYVNTYK